MSLLVRHHLPRRVTCTLLFEVGLPAAALAATAVWTGLPRRLVAASDTPLLVATVVACPLLVQGGFWLCGLYSRRCVYAGQGLPLRLCAAAALILPVLAVLLLAVRPFAGPAWPSLVLSCAGATGVCVTGAWLARWVVLHHFNHGAHYGRILIVGDRNCLPLVVEEVRRTHGDSLEMVGMLGCDDCPGACRSADLPLLGGLGSLAEVVRRHRVNTVVMSLRHDEPAAFLGTLVACRLAGVEIIDSGDFYESICHKLLLERRDSLNSLAWGPHRVSPWQWRAKALGDKVLAGTLLTLLAVPCAVVAAAIALAGDGPVTYRQQRVGRGGRPFTMLKFRTMSIDAEARSGPAWARPADPRVTPVGRWLRRTRFDEVPQLVNILRGEMAFVGPRPERPAFVADLAEAIPAYPYRHLVKPGLTGWAQVNFGYGVGVAGAREKLRYDLYYLKNMSPLLDLAIVAATLRAVVAGQGVR
ncbi:exopolysaccharide biosynthesis polyprenyl glycosylphosphotransferase [bacterium]|nr:exopolysaccharide biosynthesis polyprenyl glycosylphosphotransferase [bacterium]